MSCKNYPDIEQALLNRGYVITIIHIPTGQEVWFKGMITRLSDRFQSNWEDQTVYGRMDPISIFKGTTRVISLAWDVVSSCLEEAKENMKKLSLLMSMLYPVYSGDGAATISTAPLLKLDFTNLIQNSINGNLSSLVGKVDGFSFEPILEEQFFDTPMGTLYPKSFNLSCNFTVLHTHKLGWGQDKKTRQGNMFPYGERIEEEQERKDVKTTKETVATGTKETVAARENKILGVKK